MVMFMLVAIQVFWDLCTNSYLEKKREIFSSGSLKNKNKVNIFLYTFYNLYLLQVILHCVLCMYLLR